MKHFYKVVIFIHCCKTPGKFRIFSKEKKNHLLISCVLGLTNSQDSMHYFLN